MRMKLSVYLNKHSINSGCVTIHSPISLAPHTREVALHCEGGDQLSQNLEPVTRTRSLHLDDLELQWWLLQLRKAMKAAPC